MILRIFREIPRTIIDWERWVTEQDTYIEDRINSGAVSGNLEAGNFIRGAGSPEGVVEASPGALYTNTNGGTSTTLYVKETGTGAYGWIAK